MSEAKTPLGDIPSLYSLAANGDSGVMAQLFDLYKEFIGVTADNFQIEYKTRIDTEDLLQEGALGILNSLQSIQLNSDCPTYAAWIEKNIRAALLERIQSESRNLGHG